MSIKTLSYPLPTLFIWYITFAPCHIYDHLYSSKFIFELWTLDCPKRIKKKHSRHPVFKTPSQVMSATLFGFNTEAQLCNNILTSSQTCMTIEVFAPSPHIPHHILVSYILDSYESPQLLTSENTCHNRDVFCVLVCLYLQKLFRYMTCNSEKKSCSFPHRTMRRS